ncbi:MAG: hypothetical protein J0L61_00490 [Planctomycetes bacterium]|nr:hypothetical protein [Planctomycetota bacterium]
MSPLRIIAIALLAAAALVSEPPAPVSPPAGSEPRRVEPAGSTPRQPARRLLREGTFLSDRQGWMRPVGADRWAFIFDPADGGTDAPMALVPSLKLMEMRRIVEARPETVTFKVSGRVTVFKGRNYLLVTFFTSVADAPEADSNPSLTPEQEEQARRAFDDMMGRDPSEDANADALVRSVDRATPNQSARPAPSKPRTPDAPADASLVREGVMMSSRRGRVLRANTGELVFAPDSAPTRAGSAPAAHATPLRLIPCLNLQEMERLMQSHPASLQFELSGPVYVYEGRNYLMPSMYLIVADRDGNLIPGQ